MSRPAARSEIEQLRQSLAESERAIDDLQSALAATAESAETGRTLMHIAEQCVLNAWAQLQAFWDLGLDNVLLKELGCSDRLRWLIFAEWMRLTPAVRSAHPLEYVFGPRFVESVERQARVKEDRLARACAMVACGMAGTGLALRGLAVEVTRRVEASNRPDDTTAWEAHVVGTTPTDPEPAFRLLYRTLSPDRAELVALAFPSPRRSLVPPRRWPKEAQRPLQ